MTAWNFLLVGLAMYTGIGCLEVKYGTWIWKNLQWFQPTRDEVYWYITYSAVFITTLLVVHRVFPIGKGIASRLLRTWPRLNVGTYLFVIGLCGAITVLSFFTSHITFIGPAMIKLSHKAAVFACVFSFILWYKNRTNVAWLALFIGVFAIAALYAMLVSSGRRLLLSVFIGPFLYMYWLQVRYWKPQYSLAVLGVAAAAILVVSIGYSSFRWFSKGNQKSERTTATIIEQIRQLAQREDLFASFFADKLHYFSQYNVHYSLLAKRLVDTGALEPIPLNTLRFIASYPIPRRIWANKPETVSIVILRHVGEWRNTTWPVGPPGHGAYEGGIPALILYAFLIATAMRFVDEPLRSQPDNPFLISVLAAASFHILALPRGDFGSMSTNIIECYVFVFILNIGCRFLFGTDRTPSRVGLPAVSATSPYRSPGRNVVSQR